MGCVREQLPLQTKRAAGMPWPCTAMDASAVLPNTGFACICAHISMQDLESLKKQLSALLRWGA